MRAHKLFVVVAYDITNNRKRYRVVKILKKYGVPVNKSVYECMVTASQLEKIQQKMEKIIDKSTDQIVYYTMCINCFTHIKYQPEKRLKGTDIVSII